MVDRFAHVKKGEPLRIPAASWNAHQDAAKAHAQSKLDAQAARPVEERRDATYISVQNETGLDLDRFAVVGIDSPIFTPDENADLFAARATANGAIPAVASHTRKFAILVEPAKAGTIAKACIAGVTPALITVTNEAHTHASIVDGDTTLTSGIGGRVEIIWKETGTGAGVRAMVRVGVDPAPFFAKLTGSTPDPSNANVHRYGWEEIHATAADGVTTFSGGRSGTTSSDYALHAGEINNPASGGKMGTGGDTSDTTATIAMLPVGWAATLEHITIGLMHFAYLTTGGVRPIFTPMPNPYTVECGAST